MIKTISETLKRHFIRNIVLYVIITLSFTVGISTGALTVNALSGTQNQDLSAYVQDFFKILNTQNVDNFQILKTSILNNFKMVVMLWLLGITVIGIPFVLILIGIKGFVTGFTIGLFIRLLSFKGIFLSTLGILPQSLIAVPCYIILGVICVNFSISILKSRKVPAKRGEDTKMKFFAYCTVCVIMFCALTLGSVIEAYITPVFIKAILSSLMN